MKTIATTLGILAVSVLLGGRAEANAVLNTAPIVSAGGGDEMACAAVNVGKKPLTILVETIAPTGATSGTNSCTVDPGHECHFDGGSNVNTGFTHCRLTVTGGGKNDVRASFCNVTKGLCTDVR